ncbi:MAG: hypothetical protein M3N93_06550 [Acidobacteriota bacterium]|nr:hypothetical protein [Acidobacteriota bacterium]
MNQAVRVRRRTAASVFSESQPEWSQEAVSQKLSQQYSRHGRVRSMTSRGDNRSLRHSADHPVSPRAREFHSTARHVSQDLRIGLPRRTHTK